MAPKSRSASRAKLMNPSPQDLRDLVLDYLMHNCHTSAARAFMRECGVKRADSDGDATMAAVPERITSEEDLLALEERIAMGELRKEIRDHILTGRIDEATELLNKHFPSVLSVPMEEDDSEPPSSRRFAYLPATSTDPVHLALNLRIQAFIEAARTVPLPYTPPGSDTPLLCPPLLLDSTTKAKPGEGSEEDEDDDAEVTDEATEQANAQLLHRAQSLYSEVNGLTHPTDRAMYLAELGQVGGIIAYPVPERSPLEKYMAQSRREAVAAQIDSAILHRANRPTISRIELYARYTGAIWSMLHDMNVNVPPRNKWPANVSLPPSRAGESKPAAKEFTSIEDVIAATKKTNEKETEEVLPRFDLHLFIDPPTDR
ncbi:CTLH/CRA C-terminal to lish motif domain-containing protein [Cubamyces lactineus]|nr:CTLH/CRA C-terminal to lish motif domain-containing protein [Cubamyces lactineus]